MMVRTPKTGATGMLVLWKIGPGISDSKASGAVFVEVGNRTGKQGQISSPAPLPAYPASGLDLLLRQHGGAAPLDHVGHRYPAHAVVAGAKGVLHPGAPGHSSAGPHDALSVPAPRAACASDYHPPPLALAPTQHLEFDGHDPLRLSPLEEHPMQSLQHSRRRDAIAVHNLGEVAGADAGPPGRLVLADPVGPHPLPYGLPVDACAQGRGDLTRAFRADSTRAWTFTLMFLRPRDARTMYP